MRYAIALLILFTIVSFVFADDNLPNLQQPKYRIYTAGQPTEQGFKELAAMGVKTVINVLPESECLATEEAMVTANHMAYHKVPFHTSGFKMATIHDFAALIKSVELPVLVHCSTGNHAGGLWFAYRVLIDKAPLPIALKEGRQVGMKPELEDPLFAWVVQQMQTSPSGQEVGK